MGVGFGMFQILFFAVFALVLGTIVYTLVRGAKQEHKNNQSPRLDVAATVAGKRTQVGRSAHGSDDMMHHTYSRYFVTFQFASGDRMELPVSGTEYGMLIEGDHGTLHVQGTRYLGFDRA